jgi:penicillin-insensitive murein endopeptidase
LIRVGRFLLAALILSPAAAAPGVAGDASGPAPGPPQAIGTAVAGCVQGALALPLAGEGYQVLRPDRRRNWAAPGTVAFVQTLAAAALAEGLGIVLVGDMGLARGGPMPSGHASHQSGLDVDIWFRLPDRPLVAAQLDRPVPLGMVRGAEVDPAHWGPAQARLLELAAGAPGVDRLFVNPAIKKALCQTVPPGRRAWLGRLRPWWGHDSHFHVRLACPADSSLCEPQAPLAGDEGCGEEIDSWLARPTVPAPPERPHVQSRPLPAACAAVLGR